MTSIRSITRGESAAFYTLPNELIRIKDSWGAYVTASAESETVSGEHEPAMTNYWEASYILTASAEALIDFSGLST